MGGPAPGGNPPQEDLPDVSPEAAAAVFELEQLLTRTETTEREIGRTGKFQTSTKRVVKNFGQQLQPDGTFKLVGQDAARINEIAERFSTTGFEVFQMAQADLKGGNITSRLRHQIGPGDAARAQKESGAANQGQQVSTIEQENQRQGVTTGNAPARRSSGGRRRTIVSLDGSGGRPSILGD